MRSEQIRHFLKDSTFPGIRPFASSMWAVWVYGYGSEKAAFWKAFEEGDTQPGSLRAGQSAAMVHEIQPCADIIKSYFDGTEAVIETITSKLK